MNSSGDIIRRVGPLPQAVFSLSTTYPAALVFTSSLVGAGTCDAAARLSQRLAAIRPGARSGVQAETVDVDAHGPIEAHPPGHCALHRQHLLASAETEGDPRHHREE
jgi:hypothetical protein